MSPDCLTLPTISKSYSRFIKFFRLIYKKVSIYIMACLFKLDLACNEHFLSPS